MRIIGGSRHTGSRIGTHQIPPSFVCDNRSMIAVRLAIPLLVIVACGGGSGSTTIDPGSMEPAGVHECASATRGEIDEFFGTPTPEGVYNAPFIFVAVCVWSGADAKLVLTLYSPPSQSASEIAANFGEIEPVEDVGIEAWWSPGAESSLLVVDLGPTLMQLEWTAPESSQDLDALSALANAMIARIPGADI